MLSDASVSKPNPIVLVHKLSNTVMFPPVTDHFDMRSDRQLPSFLMAQLVKPWGTFSVSTGMSNGKCRYVMLCDENVLEQPTSAGITLSTSEHPAYLHLQVLDSMPVVPQLLLQP